LKYYYLKYYIELSNNIIDYWSIEHLLIIELSIMIIEVLIIDVGLSIIIDYAVCQTLLELYSLNSYCLGVNLSRPKGRIP